MDREPIVIVSGVRTPMGGFQGSLSPVSATELGTIVVKEAVRRAGLAPEDVDHVILGCVLPAGLKQNPARQAALEAGLPVETGCTTLNRVCGSGMQAAIFAHDQLVVGSHRVMVAGGMESMSNAPYLMTKARAGIRMGHSEIKDHMLLEGLEDAGSGKLMGALAQEIADRYGLTREMMDAFAIRSTKRSQAAIKKGLIKDEIIPVMVKTRKGEVLVEVDEQPGNAKLDKVPRLKPAFKKDGTITAANSSSISDGASALVLMRESEAKHRGLKIMARIVAHATNSRHPAEFSLAPIGAVQKLFDKSGWIKDDVDIFEINEAFAVVTMLAIQKLGLDAEKVNLHGGACAQGHPLGSTGSRIMVTLMYALHRYGKKRGVATLCIGGGEATAVALEIP
jgi:acetyl-CoA C-acetyltransferase